MYNTCYEFKYCFKIIHKGKEGTKKTLFLTPSRTVDCDLCLGGPGTCYVRKVTEIENVKSFREEGEYRGIRILAWELEESWDMGQHNVRLPRFGNRSLRQCGPLLFLAPILSLPFTQRKNSFSGPLLPTTLRIPTISTNRICISTDDPHTHSFSVRFIWLFQLLDFDFRFLRLTRVVSCNQSLTRNRVWIRL